ncbi:three-helix bundle dimerization domain-containing protein [Rhodococcus sp. NPDC079359]|uniref:three-helix bundle dimerization domain-containing protein n=1 Tax=unclassified Rhodococcus (in: high G+C Gram-positive bacteria) TaxID=192944 RepID=UPI00344F73F7
MTTTQENHIAEIGVRLGTAFPDTATAVIDEAIATEYSRFDGRTIRDFVPLLVERSTRAALHAAANRGHKAPTRSVFLTPH